MERLDEAKREMTFEEEHAILLKEVDELFAQETEGDEPPFVNCIIRRALRCIKKLKAKYQDAEEQGLLHIAPLKDGIPIFVHQEDFDDGWFIHTESYKYGVTEYFYGQLGKDFWTTKEEAEQALAEMGGE